MWESQFMPMERSPVWGAGIPRDFQSGLLLPGGAGCHRGLRQKDGGTDERTDRFADSSTGDGALGGCHVLPELYPDSVGGQIGLCGGGSLPRLPCAPNSGAPILPSAHHPVPIIPVLHAPSCVPDADRENMLLPGLFGVCVAEITSQCRAPPCTRSSQHLETPPSVHQVPAPSCHPSAEHRQGCLPHSHLRACGRPLHPNLCPPICDGALPRLAAAGAPISAGFLSACSCCGVQAGLGRTSPASLIVSSCGGGGTGGAGHVSTWRWPRGAGGSARQRVMPGAWGPPPPSAQLTTWGPGLGSTKHLKKREGGRSLSRGAPASPTPPPCVRLWPRAQRGPGWDGRQW